MRADDYYFLRFTASPEKQSCNLSKFLPNDAKHSLLLFCILAKGPNVLLYTGIFTVFKFTRPNPIISSYDVFNKLTSVFYASVLLLIMNCVITLSK